MNEGLFFLFGAVCGSGLGVFIGILLGMFMLRRVLSRMEHTVVLDGLSLNELFALQRDVGLELAKKLEVRSWERKMGESN